MRDVILLMVKWPEPGRVKTRIAATTGPVRAAEIYRELVARVCAQLPPEVPVMVCFDPAEKMEAVREWIGPMLPQATGWVAQCEGDLGARLKAGFAGAFALGFGRVAVIGSDCVGLSPALLCEAFAALAASDVVLGPTTDGGYYLMALSEARPGLFEGIRWSTEFTLGDTLRQAVGLKVRQLATLDDVDTEADWRIVKTGKN